MPRNSIEYNLTNKLFKNSSKRFIIDINDHEDVQITSCIHSKDHDNHYLINLEEDGCLPKELKYKINKGKKGKLQFRAYSLDKKDKNLREAILGLFDDKMNTQPQRQTNFIDYLNKDNSRHTRSRRLISSSAATPATNNTSSNQQEGDRLNESTTTQRSNAKKSTVASAVADKTTATINKRTKRARSTDEDQDALAASTTKRRKTTYNQDSTGNKRVTRSNSKSRSNSKARNNSKPRKSKDKVAKDKVVKDKVVKDKVEKDKKTTTATNKSTAAAAAATNKKQDSKSIELIVLESTVESSNHDLECLSDNENNQMQTDQPDQTQAVAADSDAEIRRRLITNEIRNDLLRRFENEEDFANLFEINSSDQAVQSSSKRKQTRSSCSSEVKRNYTDNDDDHQERASTSQSRTKFVNYDELEKRLSKLKEQNEQNNERLKQFKSFNQTKLKRVKQMQQQDQERKSIYHLNNNLISIDNRLGQKHLITCLTIILIGELVHYMQPQSSLNYDQLPVGCLLISNLINSVQFTILGHFAYKFTNLIMPKLFCLFKTSSRLICYCLLLFLSYGITRKSITNWMITNNGAVKLFPLNVVLCGAMLMLYAFFALCLSTDGQKIVRKKQKKHNINDLSDEEDCCLNGMVKDVANLKSSQRKGASWFISIVNLLTPYIIISPIVGSNSCRLYTVPKPVLILSAIIYLIGLYKYISCRLERTKLKAASGSQSTKSMVYELKSNCYLISKTSTRIRFLTFFGALLIITSYNLLVLNLWSLILEFLTIFYLKLKSRNLDQHFNQMNKNVYTKFKSDNPYIFIPYLH